MDEGWTLIYDGFDRNKHPLHEALCTLGNGYITVRGALELHRNTARADDDLAGEEPLAMGQGKSWNYPGGYMAGGYNRLNTRMQERVVENEDLVNWPNWLYLSFRIHKGTWFDMDQQEILTYKTLLDLKNGTLIRRMKFKDRQGNITSIESQRIVSMHNPHLAMIRWRLVAENWEGELSVRSAIDGNLINNNVQRYSQLNQKHLAILEGGHFGDSCMYLVSRATQSQVLVAQAAITEFYCGGEKIPLHHRAIKTGRLVGGDFTLACSRGEEVVIEKKVSWFSSRDMAIADPLTEARNQIRRMGSFEQIMERHVTAWEKIWLYNTFELHTDHSLDQLLTRVHIFHLYQTVSDNSIDYDIGIPARGWHGEAYRGHIFWDELYIQPYIDLHYPQLSRSLLMYRYRRLAEARHAASVAGFRGAKYPWQSGSNGREETQKIHLNPKSGRWLPDVSHLQYHINAAIPYNVWHYYQSSGDMDFLLSHGAEIILSTALFWSDITTFNKDRKRYEIKGVMGPDEYHTHYPDAAEDQPGLDNNAYTNIMAVWVMQHALKVLEILGDDCCNTLEKSVGYTKEDLQRWEDITHKMFIPFEGNIILQFEGYEKLKELDWETYRREYGNSMRLDRILEAEGDSCNYYKASKQADVLMLFYLFSREQLKEMFTRLGYELTGEAIPENIEYYKKRTAHGSTLSQVIHSWVYARSHRSESWKHFRNALLSDFNDVQGGTTPEGIHLGAMVGTLDILQRCYTGLEIRDDVLWFNPQLPSEIRQMSFHLRYRGHWMKLMLSHQQLTIVFDKGWSNPVTIGVKGKTYRFETNDNKSFNL
jgi:trehalose/maltose hydrolase-like predicted phosphorylase